MAIVKDVLLAIFAGYFVLDIACAFLLKRKRPLLFSHLSTVFRKEKKALLFCLGIGVAAGAGTYYLAHKY